MHAICAITLPLSIFQSRAALYPRNLLTSIGTRGLHVTPMAGKPSPLCGPTAPPPAVCDSQDILDLGLALVTTMMTYETQHRFVDSTYPQAGPSFAEKCLRFFPFH